MLSSPLDDRARRDILRCLIECIKIFASAWHTAQATRFVSHGVRDSDGAPVTAQIFLLSHVGQLMRYLKYLIEENSQTHCTRTQIT